MPDTLKIVLVEDDVQFSQHLQEALRLAPDIVLAGHAGTLSEGMGLLAQPPADVMLVDLGLPDGSGIELIQAAKKRWPACQVMVFTVFGDEMNIIRSIEAGATGYLLKGCTPTQLIQEIRNLHGGGSPISPIIARQILLRMQVQPAASATVAQQALASLSAREREVLNYITQGFSYADIAGKLDISYHTVRTFVRRVYIKLEVNSHIEAVSKARDRGLL